MVRRLRAADGPRLRAPRPACSQETHAARWIGFRQPVLRVALRAARARPCRTWHAHEANPGEVWEEDEFWIELSWRIDPDGALGIRKYFESPYRPGEKLTRRRVLPLDLREPRARACPRPPQPRGSTPLAYMRKYGAFLGRGRRRTRTARDSRVRRARRSTARAVDRRPRDVVDEGRRSRSASTIDGARVRRLPDARRASSSSTRTTLADWGWPEHALPGYIRSHVALVEARPRARARCVLLPTFRLPTLIHTRSRQRQVAQRDLAHATRSGSTRGRRAARRRRPAISLRGRRPRSATSSTRCG